MWRDYLSQADQLDIRQANNSRLWNDSKKRGSQLRNAFAPSTRVHVNVQQCSVLAHKNKSHTSGSTLYQRCSNTLKLGGDPKYRLSGTGLYTWLSDQAKTIFLKNIYHLWRLNWIFVYNLDEFRCTVVGLPPQRPGFDPESIHLEFVVREEALGQFPLWVLRISPVSIFPPLLYSHFHHNSTLIRRRSNRKLRNYKAMLYRIYGIVRQKLLSHCKSQKD